MWPDDEDIALVANKGSSFEDEGRSAVIIQIAFSYIE